MLSLLQKSNVSNQQLQEILDRLKVRLLVLCDPLQIILFGSAASATLKATSDLDICLIFDSQAKAENAKAIILSQPPLVGWPMDYIFIDRARFDRRKTIGGVCVEIAERGRVLYERDNQ